MGKEGLRTGWVRADVSGGLCFLVDEPQLAPLWVISESRASSLVAGALENSRESSGEAIYRGGKPLLPMFSIQYRLD